MTFIYHGPRARENLPQEAINIPFDGIDSVRAFCLQALSSSVTETSRKFSFGPLDAFSDRAIDAFLKTLEELPSDTDIYLWADNISSVKPTLVSRCFQKWFPGPLEFTDAEKAAGELLASAKDLTFVIKVSLQKDLDLKNVLMVALQKDPSLWLHVRKLFTSDTILPTELVSTLRGRWC